jgi:cell division protein ZapE
MDGSCHAPTLVPVPDSPAHLVDRSPQVPADRLVAELVPPPRFDAVRFETYRPDAAQPSQRVAVEALRGFAGRLADTSTAGAANASTLARLFRRRGGGLSAGTGASGRPGGVYLDGGFGVGKTHLLASLWHVAPQPRAFGTFVELTNLVGALGFQQAVNALAEHRLLCIDEFELDDPGDTVLMSSFLQRLSENGVALAATSNTLPGALGEGRFAAEDFLREIQGLSAHFDVVRVEGEDYRHRGLPEAPAPLADGELVARAAAAGEGGTLDDFTSLLHHLSTLHPSRYGALLDGVRAVHLRDVQTITDQSVALRFVVLADRLYDRSIPVAASGQPLDRVFAEPMLRGGYRKKYLRAVSRLVSLAR